MFHKLEPFIIRPVALHHEYLVILQRRAEAVVFNSGMMWETSRNAVDRWVVQIHDLERVYSKCLGLEADPEGRKTAVMNLVNARL